MHARFAHVNLIARDWRRLADFYVRVFACEPVPPPRSQAGDWLSRGTGVADAALEGVHLRLPGSVGAGPTLEIYTYAETLERGAPVAANRRGFGHLAFAVDDVDAAVAEVLTAGGARVGEVVERDVAGVGRLRFVYVADPEGNLLELQRWS
ncbi:MAG: VOC family protein [Nannocystaceae bacterium]